MVFPGCGNADGMKPLSFRFDEPYRAFELLETQPDRPASSGEDSPHEIDNRLAVTEELLKRTFLADQNPDLILRRFTIGRRVEALAAFLNGMASGERIDDFIIRPAQNFSPESLVEHTPKSFAKDVFQIDEVKASDDFSEAIKAIAEGQTAVFFAGIRQCLICDTRGYPSRSVGTPENEPVVLGAKEAFTESLRTNVTLLRRILLRPQFVASFRPVGKSKIALCWVEGVANRTLLEEVQRRLDRIEKTPLSIGALEQRIEDHPWLPLPQTLKTERPDRVAAALIDGKIAILLEGSPIACVLPVTLGTLFASAEDAAVRRPVGTLLRIVRGFGCVISVFLPAYFLALAEHHAGQLSGEVLSVVLSSHVMVFLPLPVEMIFLLLVFQLVREAGVRVPGVVGHAIGIIGGLLLGQAAVAAHIVSTVALIIVALSGIGNFTIPDYSTQLCVAYYRIALCIAGSLGGFLGIGCMTLATVALLASAKSFGVPMLAPVAPVTKTKRPFWVRGKLSDKPSDPINPEGEA